MSEHDKFYGENFEKNIVDLFESSQAIAVSENKAFVDKWAQVSVTVPASYIDYAALYNEMVRDYPEVIGMEIEPIEATGELSDIFGEITEPFVDYVNLIRRLSLRQAINAYVKTGYLDVGLNDKGEVDYTFTDVNMREGIREAIQKTVLAYEKF